MRYAPLLPGTTDRRRPHSPDYVRLDDEREPNSRLLLRDERGSRAPGFDGLVATASDESEQRPGRDAAAVAGAPLRSGGFH